MTRLVERTFADPYFVLGGLDLSCYTRKVALVSEPATLIARLLPDEPVPSLLWGLFGTMVEVRFGARQYGHGGQVFSGSALIATNKLDGHDRLVLPLAGALVEVFESPAPAPPAPTEPMPDIDRLIRAVERLVDALEPRATDG